MQPTMKSWQLIAVVGDALQVRREKRALNTVREGEAERESEGWRERRQLLQRLAEAH